MRCGPHRPEKFDLDPSLCWGVMVGTCIEGTRWFIDQPDIDAHVHTDDEDPWSGWICVARPKRGDIGSGRFRELVMHEYAHLLAGCGGHGPVWQDRFAELGYGKEARAHVRHHGIR